MITTLNCYSSCEAMLKKPEPHYSIRNAKKEDMVQVFHMIKELAEFEKLSDQLKINPETLMTDGFDTQNPAFSCLIAELSNGSIVGYALYYSSYSTWLGKSTFLEDLFVQPAHREKGIGKSLFLTVAKIAYQLPSKRLDFHVLSWNPASEFYKTLGAENLSDSEKWQLYRLNENALNKIFL